MDRIKKWIAVGALGVLWACSSSNDRLSAKDFRSQANQICDRMNQSFSEAFANLPTGRELTPGEAQSFFERSVPIVQRAADELADLKPPADLAATFDEYLSATRAGIANARKASASPEAAVAAPDPDPDSTRANALAKQLDLTSCDGG